ncbi:MAG: hypothetical protein KDB27_12010 [Planctomycetales bacterium]|nr:hypothetical protein [Planctomycetales bacterium]
MFVKSNCAGSAAALLICVSPFTGFSGSANASLVLSGLIGSDLTDVGDDGVELSYNPPTTLGGFDAVFSSSEEPGFEGGEFAFNVFDNKVGGGNDTWCCGDLGVFPDEPLWVQADFTNSIAAPGPVTLTAFTLTSGNDIPGRDPLVWEIQGSNNGVNFTTIFRQDSPTSVWTERNQTVKFSPTNPAGQEDPFLTNESFNVIRFAVEQTSLPAGASFKLNEIELFGTTAIPEPSAATTLGLICVLIAIVLPCRKLAGCWVGTTDSR